MNNEYDIRNIFEEMELELIRSMRRNLSRHQKWESKEGINWTMWQSEQLKTLERFKKENEKIFTEKFTSVNNEIAKFLEDTYTTSGLDQEKEILEKLSKGEIFTDSVGEGLEGSFFNINEKKMHALINAVNNDMDKAERAMLRMANDQYRKIIYKSQVMANSGAFTLKQSIDKASRDFLKQGFNCVQYKDGRRVNIASYAEMAIRTANKRAMLTSEAEARDVYGIHTVRVSKYSQCSETCLPWQGKVYVDDVWGKGTKEEAAELHLPLLSTAVDGGLFHPNCRHRVTTYFYDLKEEQGKLEDDGIEIPLEEQEHRKNQLRIQQQRRLEEGSLDSKNVVEAKQRREEISRGLAIRKGNIYQIKTSNGDTVSINVKKMIDNEIHKLIKEHPNLNGVIKEIIFDDLGNDIARASVNKKLEIRLKLHKGVFSDEEILKELLSNTPEMLSKKDGLYGYLKHEFTHILEYNCAISREKTIDDIWHAIESGKYADKLLKEALEYCNLNGYDDIIESQISYLAISNSSEAVAEAYSTNKDTELTKVIKRMVKAKWR